MYLSIVNFSGHEIKDFCCCCCCTSIGGNAPIIGHPLWGGGTPGKYKVVWGLLRGFERLSYPGGGQNEGGLFFKSLAPRGNQGTLQKKQVNLRCLKSRA